MVSMEGEQWKSGKTKLQPVRLSFGSERDRKKSRLAPSHYIMIFGFLLIAVVLAVAIPMSLSGSEASSTSGNGSTTVEPPLECPPVEEDKTCGSEDIDVSIRKKIAEFFEVFYADDSTKQPTILNFELNCLPKDCFGLVSDKTREIISQSTTLTLAGNALTAIKDGAFDNEIFGGIDTLNIQRQGLTALPTSLLQPFKKLETLDLTPNPFSTIDNPVFSNAPQLFNIVLDNNMGLVELPTDIRTQEKLNRLTCRNCSSLLKLKNGFFEGLPQLRLLDMSRSLLAEVLTTDDLIKIGGLDKGVTEIVGFS